MILNANQTMQHNYYTNKLEEAFNTWKFENSQIPETKSEKEDKLERVATAYTNYINADEIREEFYRSLKK